MASAGSSRKKGVETGPRMAATGVPHGVGALTRFRAVWPEGRAPSSGGAPRRLFGARDRLLALLGRRRLLVRTRGEPGEAGLQSVVARGGREHRGDRAPGARRVEAEPHERERAPGTHAAGAAHELADRVAQATAPGALVALLLDHERLTQPGLDLVVDDQPRERERRR